MTIDQSIYTCPMHPEVQQTNPGNCPKCGMRLVTQTDSHVSVSRAETSEEQGLKQYKPLVIIISLIALATFVLALRDMQAGAFSGVATMSYFMAGFFLVFAGFKLLDLGGFAEGYASYDLLARKVFLYGYVYPFIELGLGLAYLIQFQPGRVSLITLLVMAFSGIGVLESILKKRKFQCACLGTIIKVPLTHITLIEDFGMAMMALVMYLQYR